MTFKNGTEVGKFSLQLFFLGTYFFLPKFIATVEELAIYESTIQPHNHQIITTLFVSRLLSLSLSLPLKLNFQNVESSIRSIEKVIRSIVYSQKFYVQEEKEKDQLPKLISVSSPIRPGRW